MDDEDDADPVFDEDNPEWDETNTRPLDDPEKLKLARLRLDLSQTEMAALLRVPVATLRNWEQRRTKPDGPARTLIALLDKDPHGMRERLQRVAA